MAEHDPDRALGRACASMRPLLREVMDGAASFDRTDALDAHAAGCARCTAALREARALRRMLDALAEPTVTRADDDAFVDAVLGRLDGADAIGERRRGIGPVRLLRGALAVGAAAALAAVLWPTADGEGNSETTGVARVEDASAAADPVGDAAAPIAEPVAEFGAESVAESGSEPVPEPVPGPAPDADAALEGETGALAVEFDLPQEDVDPELFALALEESARQLDFEPHTAADAREYAARVQSTLGTSPRRAARAWLASHAPSPRLDALSARVLGPGADFRDRRLLERSLERTGAAGRWAVAAQGSTGVQSLWRAAADDPASRSVLVALVRERGSEAVDLAPRGVATALVADVARAAASEPAERLLARFLETGDGAWRSAWRASKEAPGALVDALPKNARRASDDELQRLALALCDAPRAEGLDVALEGLLRGDAAGTAAAEALAALGGTGGAEALIGATRSGRLAAATEDAAWRAMLLAAPDALVRATAEDDAFDLGVDAVLRQTDGRRALWDGALAFLVATAEHGLADDGARVRALLAIAQLGAVRPAPELRARIERLQDEASSGVAAAAWLARLALGAPEREAPPAVRATVAQGGPVSVVHLRLERALRRARGPGSE
ncbi:MAG: hypothetical protein AAFR54_08965 [Planctomycetota bacterium]